MTAKLQPGSAKKSIPSADISHFCGLTRPPPKATVPAGKMHPLLHLKPLHSCAMTFQVSEVNLAAAGGHRQGRDQAAACAVGVAGRWAARQVRGGGEGKPRSPAGTYLSRAVTAPPKAACQKILIAAFSSSATLQHRASSAFASPKWIWCCSNYLARKDTN